MTDEEKRQFEILKEEVINHIFWCRRLEQELEESRNETAHWYNQCAQKEEHIKVLEERLSILTKDMDVVMADVEEEKCATV